MDAPRPRVGGRWRLALVGLVLAATAAFAADIALRVGPRNWSRLELSWSQVVIEPHGPATRSWTLRVASDGSWSRTGDPVDAAWLGVESAHGSSARTARAGLGEAGVLAVDDLGGFLAALTGLAGRAGILLDRLAFRSVAHPAHVRLRVTLPGGRIVELDARAHSPEARVVAPVRRLLAAADVRPVVSADRR